MCQQPDVYLRHLGHRGQCRGKLGLDAGEHPRQHDEPCHDPVIGQCLGAGEKKQAQRYSVTLLGIAITGLTVTNAALFFLMPEVVTWFNLSAEASAMCTHVVHWFNLFSIFFWATSFTLPNALRAGGDAKFTMSVSIVSMWLFRVILSYIFVLQFHLGLTGVWFGMFIDWICRSLCFLVRFARGKWMEHKVI